LPITLAEQRFDFGGAMALTDTIETNQCCPMASDGAGFALECIDEIRGFAAAARSRWRAARPAAQQERCVAGDLHLRNICARRQADPIRLPSILGRARLYRRPMICLC
jgi:hypothetical protein